MKQILFVRHTQTQAAAGVISPGRDGLVLSERGERQARELAPRLPGPAARVLVSPMQRARQTAAPYCARHGLSPQVDGDLAEFTVIDPQTIGGVTGARRKPYLDAYWADPDPDRREGAAADTFAEFLSRVESFRARLDSLPDGTLIFGHAVWFSLLLWRQLGFAAACADDLRRFRRFQLSLPMPHAAVFALEGSGAHWALRTVDLASAE